jgi:hypothetical protein
MTAAAVAAASAMPAHALQSAIFAAMTAAAAAARLSDFAIISEPDAHGAAAVVAPAVAPISINKSHANYSVFSLVPTISLPTIADTGATQHTTNRHDLLHNFIPLAVPSCLVCANSGHIKCVGHSTLRSTTIVNGQQSGIVMCNVAYVPRTRSYCCSNSLTPGATSYSTSFTGSSSSWMTSYAFSATVVVICSISTSPSLLPP